MVFSQKLAKRYKELKEDVPDCLLLMQVGVFMQVMDEDARAVSAVPTLPDGAVGRHNRKVSLVPKLCLGQTKLTSFPNSVWTKRS